MKISVAKAKEIREDLNATHLILFTIDGDGVQHVATHGLTEKDALQAAKAGNKLKKLLGWPEDLCKSKPVQRICKNCTYWKADYGMWCFNGWSDDGSRGWCRFEPQHVKTDKDNTCGFFTPDC